MSVVSFGDETSLLEAFPFFVKLLCNSPGRGIGFEADIPPDLPPLRLDVKELAEALDQLLDNAIKFNRPGGRVKLAVRVEPEMVILTVADTGAGIEPEILDRMWGVFEQEVDPLRRAQAGLGLGLVLARHIVEAHQGTITVETRLGQGTVFTVILPRLEYRMTKRQPDGVQYSQ